MSSAAKLKLVGGTATGSGAGQSGEHIEDPSTSISAHSYLEQLGLQPLHRGRLRTIEDWQYVAEFASTKERVQAISRIAAEFHSLVARWKEDTAALSSMTEILLHPAYQRIIGMGSPALPFILRELNDSGGHWFWALQAISGKNPVSPELRGRTRAMKDAWISWGKTEGLI